MKKIVCLLLSLTIGISASFAQAAQQANRASQQPSANRAAVSRGPQSPASTSPMQSSAAPQGATKKDGTPDMRRTENKQAAKPAGRMKKDGTPDMRYKENKPAKKN